MVDQLYVYAKELIPTETTHNLGFRKEKLKMVRENKENLASIIEKKRLTERIDLDSNKTTEEEVYSSERLWEIVKTNKYDLT